LPWLNFEDANTKQEAPSAAESHEHYSFDVLENDNTQEQINSSGPQTDFEFTQDTHTPNTVEQNAPQTKESTHQAVSDTLSDLQNDDAEKTDTQATQEINNLQTLSQDELQNLLKELLEDKSDNQTHKE